MNRNQTYRFWRSAAQCLLGGVAVALVTFVCFRLNVSITTAALLYLIVVVLASLTGSFVLSSVVSIIAILCLDYFFTAPFFSLTLIEPLDAVALITFLGTALVITSLMSKRKQAEEVLRQQADLLNLTHDTIFVRDMNDVITYWNRGAEEFYGWTAEEVVGKVTNQQLLQTVFPAPLEQINAELLRTGRWEGELYAHQGRWNPGGGGQPVVFAARRARPAARDSRPTTTLPSASERRTKFANSTTNLNKGSLNGPLSLKPLIKNYKHLLIPYRMDLACAPASYGRVRRATSEECCFPSG